VLVMKKPLLVIDQQGLLAILQPARLARLVDP